MMHDGAATFDEAIHSTASELLEANDRFAAGFADAGMDVRPRRKLAVVACMDSRMDIFALLGLNAKELLLVIPFVERLRLIEAFVALKADQLGAGDLRH